MRIGRGLRIRNDTLIGSINLMMSMDVIRSVAFVGQPYLDILLSSCLDECCVSKQTRGLKYLTLQVMLSDRD